MDIPPHPGQGRRPAVAFAALLVAVFFLVLVTPPAVAGGTQTVTGHITGNATWGTGTTIIMTGNVTVDAGVVLTIEPGVTVLAYPNVHLYVNGMLEANGTSTSLITFSNYTLNRIWGGIQFNGTSKASYLQYASIAYADRGVRAIGSSPTIRNDVIDHAIVGIELQKSSASVWLTRINYSAMGIHANGTGSPVIAIVTITTVLGAPTLGIPSIGIFADHLDYIDVASVTIQWVNGSNAGNAAGSLGAAGGDGGFAAGVFVNATTFAILGGNTIGPILGGRGGNGAPNSAGVGGAGGAGGPAAGIVFANSPTSRAQGNTVSGIAGGHGGDGGITGLVGSKGGRGGAGGAGVALESLNATTIGWWFSSTFQSIAGGSGGNGGGAISAATPGNGGAGGDALGVLASEDAAANASALTIQTLRGGYGGNGTAGGAGGNATGLTFLTVTGSALVSGNTIRTLTGGPGGGGNTPPGAGGSVTAVLVLGDKNYNATVVSANQISALTGGIGGVGGNPGSTGGSAVGIEGLLLTLSLSRNTIQSVTGGQGGATAPGAKAGQGGAAVGVLVGSDPFANSSLDRVQTVTRGASGTGGTPAAPALGLGAYVTGTKSIRVSARLVNDTFASVSDDDLYLDNFSNTTALNSTFSFTKLSIGTAANLTVQYFLAVTVFWPNNQTLVPGASVTVTDNGFPSVPVFSGTLPSGRRQWLPVTNRVYVDSLAPSWNTTDIDVSYLAYGFQNDPRTVNVTTSQTQYFTMVDTTPPTSTANALPTWTATLTFTIHYTYSDGLGVGVKNVTLWYSTGGAWQAYATQTVTGAGTGQFSFTAAADGTYQFATTSYDNSGNAQVPTPPTGNQTWTIVDTTKPGSHVTPLPAYETSLSFTVSWAPDAGTTDITSYQVQYNTGSGWVTWFGDTKATSAVFNATGQGVVQFRSIATDFAGNTEIPPPTNDTWTIVDTIPPASAVTALPPYENRAIFNVSWGPAPGTTDIASYSIQVSDNGGAWTAWTLATAPGSTAFTASTGHTYAFRSLAADRAGNTESKGTANDTWTFVDTTPPSSAVTSLPRYETSLTFSLAWGPATGTTDIATYTVYDSDNGGAWAALSGAVNTAATTLSFTGADGHTYAFRSVATDRAGNVESKSAGNDTFTTLDVTKPYVVADAPEGAGTNITPVITVTFSEPMNPLSVQLAFSIAPSINGNFTWSADDRVMTFIPARPLQPGASYTVVVDTSATDTAGNTLASLKTFSFATAADSASGGGFLGGSWPILLLLALVAMAAVGFLLYRRRSGQAGTVTEPKPAAPPKSPAAIDDVFLLYAKDGVLIKHETRRLRPDVDTDILSGMLTAVQQFVKDSFRGEEGEELNEMTVGQMHILIGRGKWLVLAAVMSGGDIDSMNDQMGLCIKDMEDHNWDRLEDWNGDMELSKSLAPYIRKLIRGEYTASGS